MAASDLIVEIRKNLGISRMKLAKRLRLKSHVIIWMYETKKRYPSYKTWMLIADLAKEAGIEITLDTMREI